jgi:hypothetical protein
LLDEERVSRVILGLCIREFDHHLTIGPPNEFIHGLHPRLSNVHQVTFEVYFVLNRHHRLYLGHMNRIGPPSFNVEGISIHIRATQAEAFKKREFHGFI